MQNKRNKIGRVFRKFAFNISRESYTFLSVGLAFISLVLIAFSFYVVYLSENMPFYLMRSFTYFMENILMSLLLVIIGAFLFDMVSKRRWNTCSLSWCLLSFCIIRKIRLSKNNIYYYITFFRFCQEIFHILIINYANKS